MKKHPSTRSAFVYLRLLTIFAFLCAAVFLAVIGLGLLSKADADNKERKKIDPKEEAERNAVENGPGVRVINSYYNDVSRPLREAPQIWPPVRYRREDPHEANPNPKIQHKPANSPDPVIQNNFFRRFIAPNIPAPILSFAGVPFPGVSCNCAPPDTNGAVGKNHYVQMVNEGYQVFNKAGTSVLGPISIESVWMGFAGVCETAGNGDPVVMYDQLADRWIITEFAGSTGTGVPVTDQCIAVSTTGDPTGSYYRYGYHLGSNFFDYPHLGVWPDAYYMSMNVFNAAGTAQLGVQPFAFDRAKMLIGAPATIVTTGFAPGGANEEYFLPAHLDGIIPPPAGAANPFVEFPGSTGVYKVYLMHADFVTPANTTFTLLASPAAAGFTALCPTTRACVPQPNGQTLDAIGDRLMFRNAYRKFPDGHDALVNNYTVSAGGVAGVRWFELRNVLAAPVVFQESTYQPDTTWRFLGSAAMDNQGNMAIGFSASSSTVVPGLRYAGRLAGDPANILAQGEATLFAGQGSQSSGTGNRWGDYSALTVDPVDDCTFWYTNEWYPTGSTDFNWRTQIGNFAFTQCTAPAKGTAHFTATICDGGAPLTNASVSIDGMPYGSTIAGGVYDVVLAPGNHTYSVSKATFGTATGNFTITNGNITNIPFCMTGVPVMDPAGSSLVSEGCSPSNGVIDPNETVTVNFAVANNGGLSTTNLVATLQNSGGITPISGPQSYGAIAPGGMSQKAFQFTAPNGACGQSFVATLQLQDGANNLGSITYNFSTGTVVVGNYGTGNISVPIPDSPAAAINIPITVADVMTLTDVNVSFRINHTFDGDLVISLVHPDNTVVPLVTNRGSNGVNFGSGAQDCAGTPTVMDDQAATAISAGTASFVGSFRPESPLSALNGKPSNGTWNLRIQDTAGQDVGTVYCVKLELNKHLVCCGSLMAAAPPAVVLAESAFPPNNAADPGETLTVNLPLQNLGLSNTSNLVATLQPTGGVTAPSGAQTYGVVTGGGPAVAKPFTFTASGACGGTITLTLALQDGASNLGTVTFTMPLGTTQVTSQTFTNATTITIPATGTGATTGAPATPYPSNIVVAGLPTSTSKVTVTLNNISHSFPSDVDVLLVSPTGQKFILMSDVIGGTDWSGQTYTFDDAAAALLPISGSPPASGTFKPTNYGTGDAFPVPAPASPYLTPGTAGSDTLASAFAGQNPNGTWSLFVVDDAGTDTGTFAGGWSITITTATPVCAAPITAGSVKTQGGAGAMAIGMPLAGTAGVESRSGGATNDHSVEVYFATSGYTVNGATQAQIISGTGMIGTGGVSNGGAVTISGIPPNPSICTIPLTGITNAQTIMVRLNNVTHGAETGNVLIPMSFLTGDSNGDGAVNSADVSQTKARSGQAVDGTNFRSDINADGNLNSGDISFVKSRSGTGLP